MTARATRFLVWRAARDYMDEFLDSPTSAEVARRCGLSQTHTMEVLLGLWRAGALPGYAPRRDKSGRHGQHLKKERKAAATDPWSAPIDELIH